MRKDKDIINHFLEQKVDFKDINNENIPKDGTLYAVKEGILDFAGLKPIKVYILNNGQRMFDAEDVQELVKHLDLLKEEEEK